MLSRMCAFGDHECTGKVSPYDISDGVEHLICDCPCHKEVKH